MNVSWPRSLGAVHYYRDEFTAEEVGAADGRPGEGRPAGECVGQPENGKQRQGQTRSNPWLGGQREQDAGCVRLPLMFTVIMNDEPASRAERRFFFY